MIFYSSIFILLAWLRYSLGGRPKLRDQIYPITLALLFVFSAFRFEVGCDWSGYFNQWNIQRSSTLEIALQKREPSWWAMMNGLQYLGLPYPWLNVASSAIFFLGVHALARRQPDPLGFLILLFPILIINMPTSGIRQAAAIGIICIAFVAFVDKKLISFIFWTLLAASLHNSASIFLLLAPMVGGSFSKKRLLMATILAVPGVLILSGTESAELATDRYVESGIDAAGSAFRVGLLWISGVVYVVFLAGQWKDTFPQDYKLASVGALIMCAIIFLVPLSTVIGDRLAYYLIPIQTAIFARIPYLPIKKSRRIYSSAPYIGLVVVLLVWTSLSRHFQICYVPYQNWLFGLPSVTQYVY